MATVAFCWLLMGILAYHQFIEPDKKANGGAIGKVLFVLISPVVVLSFLVVTLLRKVL